MLDKDGNGYADKNEVRSILNQHGHISSEKTEADLNEIFSSADINQDGKIDFEEFVSTICKAITWSHIKKIRWAYQINIFNATNINFLFLNRPSKNLYKQYRLYC